jgi:hypothetical protein
MLQRGKAEEDALASFGLVLVPKLQLGNVALEALASFVQTFES